MVEAGVVVVVVEVVVAPVPVPVDDDPDPLVVVVVVVAPELGVVVVVAVAVAGGATKATVSPCIVAALVEGVADRPVQPRAAVQLWSAVAAGGCWATVIAAAKHNAAASAPTRQSPPSLSRFMLIDSPCLLPRL